MKTQTEKEKKLDTALNKLINLNLNKNDNESLESLNRQKNQLEIEKKELINKYDALTQDHQKIKEELANYKQQKIQEQSKEAEFSEKIDELNQETDTLLEEIDKWQM